MSKGQQRFYATDKNGGRRVEENEEGKDVSQEDHDILIRVHENVQNLTNLVQTNFADHEGRLRENEKNINYAKGGLKVLYALATLLATAQVLMWFVK